MIGPLNSTIPGSAVQIEPGPARPWLPPLARNPRQACLSQPIAAIRARATGARRGTSLNRDICHEGRPREHRHAREVPALQDVLSVAFQQGIAATFFPRPASGAGFWENCCHCLVTLLQRHRPASAKKTTFSVGSLRLEPRRVLERVPDGRCQQPRIFARRRRKTVPRLDFITQSDPAVTTNSARSK